MGVKLLLHLHDVLQCKPNLKNETTIGWFARDTVPTNRHFQEVGVNDTDANFEQIETESIIPKPIYKILIPASIVYKKTLIFYKNPIFHTWVSELLIPDQYIINCVRWHWFRDLASACLLARCPSQINPRGDSVSKFVCATHKLPGWLVYACVHMLCEAFRVDLVAAEK